MVGGIPDNRLLHYPRKFAMKFDVKDTSEMRAILKNLNQNLLLNETADIPGYSMWI